MNRNGYSLIEVILATAMLLGAVTVLSELARLGRRQSNRAETLSEAQLVCERTLNELLLGERPLQPVLEEPLLERPDLIDSDNSVESTEFEADHFNDPTLATADQSDVSVRSPAQWLHTVRLEPLGDNARLTLLTVEVIENRTNRQRPERFRLHRWIRNPAPAAGGVNAELTSGTELAL